MNAQGLGKDYAERINLLRFDPKEELDRAVRSAELSLPIRLMSLSSRREDKEAQRAISGVDSAEANYRAKLEVARESGAINAEDYKKAQSELMWPYNPFERLRGKVRRDNIL